MGPHCWGVFRVKTAPTYRGRVQFAALQQTAGTRVIDVDMKVYEDSESPWQRR